MNILGIDISTSNIGMVVADESDNIQEFISIPLSKLVKDKCLFKKLFLFEKIIEKILEKYTIDHVFIEKPLEFFKEGSSMSSTIILLNQFNMLCQYVLYQKKIKYHMVASSTALKCATGTGRKPSYVADKKIWLADFFEKKHPEIELKRKKDGITIHPSVYDPIDAWCQTQCIKSLATLE